MLLDDTCGKFGAQQREPVCPKIVTLPAAVDTNSGRVARRRCSRLRLSLCDNEIVPKQRFVDRDTNERHREERSDVAIQGADAVDLDRFACGSQ